MNSSSYKKEKQKLDDLRKQRKRIKRRYDRIENPTDGDKDELDDIDDDIEDAQEITNEFLDKKNDYASKWKWCLFLYGILVVIIIVFTWYYTKKMTDGIMDSTDNFDKGTHNTLDDLNSDDEYNPWNPDENGDVDYDYINEHYYDYFER